MDYLLDHDIDIATITETWLTSERNSVTAVIGNYGYKLLHTYRNDRGGGGVAILYKSWLKIKPIKQKLTVETFEYLCCTVEFINQPITKLISVYRPGAPHSRVLEFCN